MAFKIVFYITYGLITGFLCLVEMGCVPKALPPTSGKTISILPTNRYQEDLSVFRPVYRVNTEKNAPTKSSIPPVKATSLASWNITTKLNSLLDTISIRNKVIKSANGYRVQIYVGESREEASAARNKSYQLLPEETPYLIPTLPSYRVRVGNFLDRLDAQKAYAQLIREFPTAVVVSDKIEIVR
jgi:hypothetical protein